MSDAQPESGNESMQLAGDGYQLSLTQQTIDAQSLIEAVRDHQCGAVVLFLGTVRELTDGKQTVALQYDAYPKMALTELQTIVVESRQQWPLQHVTIEHRLGPLELGDIAVGIAVSSPHRAEAFTAAADIMSRIKQTVPIWKKEKWADGTTEWIHPN